MRGSIHRVLSISGLDEPRIKSKFNLFIFVVIAGCIAGSIISGTMSAVDADSAKPLLAGFYVHYKEPVFATVFARSVLSSAIYYAACLLASVFAFGSVISGGAAFVKGLSCGMTAGLLSCNFGLSGFAFYVLAILPGFLISSLVITYFSALSCESSLGYLNIFLGKGRKKNNAGMSVQWAIICLVILLLTALLDAALSILFKAIL